MPVICPAMSVRILSSKVLTSARDPTERRRTASIRSRVSSPWPHRTGIALAGSAALIKVCTNILQQGVLTLLESWQLYGLIVVGVTGLMVSQIAYRTGPMTASLPAINTVDPLVSVMIGWGVFDEHFRVGAPAITAETVALALTLLATVALCRRSAKRPQPVPPSPTTESDPRKVSQGHTVTPITKPRAKGSAKSTVFTGGSHRALLVSLPEASMLVLSPHGVRTRDNRRIPRSEPR